MPSLKRTPQKIIPIIKGSVEQSSDGDIYPSFKGSSLTKAIHNLQTKIIAMGKDFVWSKLV
jgi:hypothetical protein